MIKKSYSFFVAWPAADRYLKLIRFLYQGTQTLARGSKARDYTNAKRMVLTE